LQWRNTMKPSSLEMDSYHGMISDSDGN
jgi:hypothetical protein